MLPWIILLILIIVVVIVIYISIQYASLAKFQKEMEKSKLELDAKIVTIFDPKIRGKTRSEAEAIVVKDWNQHMFSVDSPTNFQFMENTCDGLDENGGWVRLVFIMKNGKVERMKFCDTKPLKPTWEGGRLVLA